VYVEWVGGSFVTSQYCDFHRVVVENTARFGTPSVVEWRAADEGWEESPATQEAEFTPLSDQWDAERISDFFNCLGRDEESEKGALVGPPTDQWDASLWREPETWADKPYLPRGRSYTIDATIGADSTPVRIKVEGDDGFALRHDHDGRIVALGLHNGVVVDVYDEGMGFSRDTTLQMLRDAGLEVDLASWNGIPVPDDLEDDAILRRRVAANSESK